MEITYIFDNLSNPYLSFLQTKPFHDMIIPVCPTIRADGKTCYQTQLAFTKRNLCITSWDIGWAGRYQHLTVPCLFSSLKALWLTGWFRISRANGAGGSESSKNRAGCHSIVFKPISQTRGWINIKNWVSQVYFVFVTSLQNIYWMLCGPAVWYCLKGTGTSGKCLSENLT